MAHRRMATPESTSSRTARRTYYLLTGGTAFCFALAFTVSSVYRIDSAGLGPLQLVFVGTVLEATVLLAEVPTGALADTRGRRVSILVGLLLIGVAFLLEGAFALFGVILCAQVIWGVGFTFTSGADTAWISDEIGEDTVGRVLLRGAQVGQVGALLGIVASALLASAHLRLPIVLAGVLTLLLALALAGRMPEHGWRRPTRHDLHTNPSLRAAVRAGLHVVRWHPLLPVLFAVGAVWGLSSEGFDRLWALHLLRDLPLPPLGPLPSVGWFGVIQGVTLIAGILATEAARRYVAGHALTLVALITMALTGAQAAAMLGFALAGHLPTALGAYWAVMLTRVVNEPLYQAWLTQGVPSHVRATIVSMGSQANALGQVAGGPMIGLIGSLVSVRAALAVSAVALLPAVGFLALAHRRRRHLGMPLAIPDGVNRFE